MKTIAARIRQKRIEPVVRKYGLTYEARIADIQRYQLSKFNILWAKIQRNVPYYHGLVQTGVVPTAIQCWDDFERFPVLTKSSIQENLDQLVDHSQKITRWSLTGGSTGEPIRVPHFSSEAQSLMPIAWLGRSFYGIEISDRIFHFWGHSHLFGNNRQRYMKQAMRMIKNRLLGYQHFSAYNLTPEQLRQAGDAIVRMKPDYIVGYSRSLALLARENADRTSFFHRSHIKAIIATSEAFGDSNDVKMIEQIFGCPVGMEYGAAETGVIAYTHPSDNCYRVFWDTFLLEAIPTNETNAELLLTSLYPRAMPLIRYDIGDIVQNYDCAGSSVVGFDTILGRDNDLIEIAKGAFVHPVALIHCIQSQRSVLGVQIVQESDNSVSISILCTAPLAKDDEATIRRNLSTLDAALGECSLNYVSHLEQTIAGKTKWVIKR